MSTTYVAIDVETTGLDPRKDAIIEVAAVTFQGNAIVDEYSTLVNPVKELPEFITQLTGITQAMVNKAPTMFKVRPRIRTVLGDNVLVGHNVGFDLGFLNEDRLGVGNHRIDTLTLAAILLPEAGRYNLESLAHYLNLPLPSEGQTHRALDDAVLTIELFLALRERAMALELWQLEEIVMAGRSLAWPETLFFEDIFAERARHAFEGDELRHKGRAKRIFNPKNKPQGKPFVPEEEPNALDVEMISALIKPGGNFSHYFPNFEFRPQQVDMLESVAEAFNNAEHLLIEAGTGTGKSMGYLLPSVFWAVENGRRVVVSTNTINLQDQLMSKDLPLLQDLLPFEIRTAIRKGRSNYLCTRLFQQMRHSGPSNKDEMAVFARILLWLDQTESGDVAELSLRTPGERMAWSRLNGDNSCTSEHCAIENCPLHIARRRAELAHVIVVNHALLLSDVANNNHILPPFLDLVVDEAHHFESAVTGGLSFEADKRYLEAILDEVVKPRSGLIGNLQNRLQASLQPDHMRSIDEFANNMRADGQNAVQNLTEFFVTLRFFLGSLGGRRSQFAQQTRLVDSVRERDGYDEVEMAWENVNQYLKGISLGFTKMAKAMTDIMESYDVEDGEDLMLALQTNGRKLEETRTNLDSIIAEPQEGMIYWVESFKERLSLHAAPLHVGPLVKQYIFDEKETVVLTSATMRTAGAQARDEANFAYIRDRLNAEEAVETAVGSPFDYKGNTLLYLISDMPEPNQPGYQRYVEDAIIEVAETIGGRTMVLFTSYSQLSQTAKAIEAPLAEAGVTVLAQTQGASRQQLLNQFKRDGARAVLLGTKSFWEGVDVPGEALQAVMIVKIPFDVPSDPIFAARSETFDNSFFEYSIPEAILRFRQGFGRLNRRMSDEGIVFVLDKRLMSKRYGRLFIEALPDCTVIRQRHERIAELTVRWFNRAR
ncbi:MAG: helicase C-terminal domain-containing protein [Chloroflexota bacterium]